MRKMLMALAAAGTMLVATAPASAAEGCGRGYHRIGNGRCVPARAYGRPGRGPVVGRYYRGRGYWSQGRYWQHRSRHHGGWRYR